MGIGQQLGAAVDGLTHAVEYSAEHILGNGQLQRVAEKSYLGLRKVYALRGVKKLNNGLIALDLEDLAAARFAAL